jgi:hypothetical protein
LTKLNLTNILSNTKPYYKEYIQNKEKNLTINYLNLILKNQNNIVKKILFNPLLNLFFINSSFMVRFFYKEWKLIILSSTNVITKQTSLFKNHKNTNILPNSNFKYCINKKIYTSLMLKKLNINFIPIYTTTVVRFMETLIGCRVLLQL